MFNKKIYTKKCVNCGKEYKTTSVRSLTCGRQCGYQHQRKEEKKKRNVRTSSNSALNDVLKKANEAGMSYGKYVAMAESEEK